MPPLGTPLFAWLRALWGRPKPDPWPADLDQAVRGPDAVPVCHRCLAALEETAWFCPQCGASVGAYNNSMPYLHIFAVGEVLRSGVGPAARFSPLTVTGYLLLAIMQASVLAPVYGVCLFLNWRRLRHQAAPHGGPDAGPTPSGEPPYTPPSGDEAP